MSFVEGPVSLEPINVFGRLGYDFNANIGVGAELNFSLIEDEFLGLDFGVTTTFVYVKGSMPIGDDSKLYAMIGPSNVELTASLGGVSASVDDNGTGIGFGYEKTLDTYSISIDYIKYYSEQDARFDAINVGLVTYF